MTNHEFQRCREDIIKLLKQQRDRSDIITFIANKYHLTRDAAGKRIRKVATQVKLPAQKLQNTANDTPDISSEVENYDYGVNNQSYSQNKDGTLTFDDIFKCKGKERPSEEDILKAHNLNPNVYEIVKFRISTYEAQQKGGKIVTMYATQLSVRKRDIGSQAELILAAMREERALCPKNYYVTRPLIKRYEQTYSEDGVVLVIILTDEHLGMFAWGQETPENFDMKIGIKGNTNAIKTICRKILAMNIKLKKIILVTDGDIIHIDNNDNSTTNGTRQQVDGRPQKIILEAKKFLIEICNTLLEIAPVEYIYVEGNHDRILGWCLAEMVAGVFEDEEDITFDTAPRPHKYRVIGKAMACFTHGEAPDSRLFDLARNLNMEEAVHCELQIVYAGHQHVAKITPFAGGYVERVPTTAPLCQWSNQMAFSNVKERYVNGYIFDGSAVPPDVIRGSIK